MVTKEHIAKTLKNYRKERKLSQEEVADRIGYAQKDVSNIENGKSGVDSITKVCLIADVLKIPYPELFFNDNILNSNNRFIRIETELGVIEYDTEQQKVIKTEEIYQNGYKNNDSIPLHSKSENIKEDNEMETFSLRKEFKPVDMTVNNPDIILSRNVNRKYNSLKNDNIVLIGGSGTGKYQNFIKPNLALGIDNYIVFGCNNILDDSNTLKNLVSKGYQLINIGNEVDGEQYDIFKNITSPNDIRTVAESIIYSQNQHSVQWTVTALQILQAIMYLIWDTSASESTILCIGKAARNIYDSGYHSRDKSDSNVPAKITELKEILKSQDKLGLIIYIFDMIKDCCQIYDVDIIFTESDKAHNLWLKAKFSAETNLIQEVAIDMSILMNSFRNLKITHNIQFSDLVNQKDNRYLINVDVDFIRTQDNYFTDLVFNQICSQLYSAVENGDTDNYNHQRFIMDEFANYSIHNFQTYFKGGRPHYASYSIIVQDLEQLMTIGENRVIMNNSDTIIFFGSSSTYTLQEISEMAGKMMVKVTADKVERIKENPHVDRFAQLIENTKSRLSTDSIQPVYETIPVITMSELATLNKNECIILTAGKEMMIDEKY